MLSREKQQYRLTFSAERTTKPLISEMIRKFDLGFEIRNGMISDTFGLIAVELEGPSAAIGRAVRWLERKGVQVDPIGLNTSKAS